MIDYIYNSIGRRLLRRQLSKGKALLFIQRFRDQRKDSMIFGVNITAAECYTDKLELQRAVESFVQITLMVDSGESPAFNRSFL